MKTRRIVPLVGIALLATLAAGCASTSGPVNLAIVNKVAPPVPGGIKIGKAAIPPAAAATPNCGDPTASLRPPAVMPTPGQMPTGSTMAKIQARGYLIAGVDQNTDLFGYRNPKDNTIEGFDIDMVHDVAQAIFGDPNKVVFKAITSAQRIPVLTGPNPAVDLVARTFTINCARLQQVAFSTVYFQASRQVLVPKTSTVQNFAQLGGKKVCATTGSDSLGQGQGQANAPIPVAVNDWSDCLVMLQQGEVDAVSTDNTILAGMETQDPNTKIVGPSIAPEPYGIAMPKADNDFVGFVNGVLQQIRTNGSWTASYGTWVQDKLGATPAPPPPAYEN
ncbi:MAG TPA: glutamate ABC transporter substrate-binding protein [Pseudonocardiaceae bacterium]|jgi:polar amino acid transport system substrate-binding protein|nr:glutamate ABC transporter substrate-binding protein [Pseudonocardiaceae bacterium]